MDGSKLRLPRPRAAAQKPAAPPEARPLPPLKVAGLVVRRAELVEALRIYVPNLCDLKVLDEGEHFYLVFGEASTSAPTDEGKEARDD